MKSDSFTSSDEVKIAYDWYPANNPVGHLLLIHMMPETKESWKNFAEKMLSAGYSSLAIDLRGHGESGGGPNGYQKFSDEEHQKSILDLEAAVEFLKQQGATAEMIILIGASIGANLCLQYLKENPTIKTAILLSAGLDYRGIKAGDLAKELHAGQEIFLFTSKDDIRSGGNNAEMNKKIFDSIPNGVRKEIIIYKQGGHGTDLLSQAENVIRDYLARRK